MPYERDQRDPLERRQFWPRPGRPEALGEIDFDQPCANCGYNMRGLPPGTPCPECGSRFGWNVGEEPIPWQADATSKPLSFFRTAFMAIVTSHDLAKHVWHPGRLNLTSAKRFRHIALCIATPPLCVIAWMITAAVTSPRVAWFSLPMDAIAIIVWLCAVTLEPVQFFKDKVSTKLLRRVECVAYYATAPLLLVPLHLVTLFVTMKPLLGSTSINPWLVAGEHIAMLLVTMALGVPLIAWLLYETVSITRAGAFAMAYARAISAIGTAVVLLLGVPTITAAVVSRMLS